MKIRTANKIKEYFEAQGHTIIKCVKTCDTNTYAITVESDGDIYKYYVECNFPFAQIAMCVKIVTTEHKIDVYTNPFRIDETVKKVEYQDE